MNNKATTTDSCITRTIQKKYKGTCFLFVLLQKKTFKDKFQISDKQTSSRLKLPCVNILCFPKNSRCVLLDYNKEGGYKKTFIRN